MEQDRLQDICWKLYRNHRSAIDTIIRYGNVNLLAITIAERVLQSLRDERQFIIADRHIEWIQSPPKPSVWIAIRPAHWSKEYRAFYGIVLETQGTTEIATVGIRSDYDKRFKELFLKMAPEHSAMLELIRFESRDLGDLERAAEKGATAMLARIKESFHLLEEVVRRWDEEPVGGDV